MSRLIYGQERQVAPHGVVVGGLEVAWLCSLCDTVKVQDNIQDTFIRRTEVGDLIQIVFLTTFAAFVSNNFVHQLLSNKTNYQTIRDTQQNSLWHDPGASFAIQGAGDVGRISDERFLAAILDELDASLNLGMHTARGEVAFVHILFGFSHSHLI